MGRGFKVCKACNAPNGPRSFNCKQCKASFGMIPKAKDAVVKTKPVKVVKFKKQKKPKQVPAIDHTVLIPGDFVRIVGSSGPFYSNNNGEKIYFTSPGKYQVEAILKDGFMAKGNNTPTEFFYMGEVKKSPIIPNLTRSPHKVLLFKERF